MRHANLTLAAIPLSSIFMAGDLKRQLRKAQHKLQKSCTKCTSFDQRANHFAERPQVIAAT